MDIRDRIEKAFEAWGAFVLHHPWTVILTMLGITALLCSGLSTLRIEASTESFLQENDPARITYNAFRAEFDGDEGAIILIHSEDIFSFEFLTRLKALHEEIETGVPYLEDINDLINARMTYGEGDELVVDELFEHWPEDEAALAAIEARARANPIFVNTILSENGNYTAINLSFTASNAPTQGEDFDAIDMEFAAISDALVTETDGPPAPPKLFDSAETAMIVEALQPLVDKYDGEGFEIQLAGGPPMTYLILNAIQQDMGKFTGLGVLAIGSLLLLLFRRLSGVALPLMTVLLPLLGTFGFMGHVGLPVTVASQIMPSFLLAVGVAHGVHLLAILFDKVDKGANRDEALIYALGHSGLAIVMTSLTTAGSLMSFLFADLKSLCDFGISAPFGVMLALTYSLTLLPALIAITPVRARQRRPGANAVNSVDRLLTAIGDFATGRPRLVVAIWVVITMASLYGALQVRFSHHPTNWFKPDHPFRVAMEVTEREMGTGLTAEVLVDTGVENGLYDPDVMQRIVRMQEYLETVEVSGVKVGKVISLTDIVKETHQALNANDPAAYTIPASRELIAQELLLFENSGSDDLTQVTDPLFQKARLTLMIPAEDSLHYKAFLEETIVELRHIAGDSATVEITGLIHLSARTNAAMMTSMAKSYTIALLVITPLMILLIGELRLGLISMIPNVAPILLALGLMYWFEFALDPFSMLIGSIALGIAVDDTIHFMHNFRRYFDETGDARLAVHKTLLSTGRALLVTSIVLATGFFVFAGASMIVIINFGLITGYAVLIAFLADVLLSPALVVLATQREQRPKRGAGASQDFDSSILEDGLPSHL